LSEDVSRHICGILENWAQLCQEGRGRVCSSWRYLKYGRDLLPVCRLRLLKDLRWWLAKARLWATGDADGCYPIITGAYLSAHPEAFHVSATDFSGTDGIGGITGNFTDSNPRYFSLDQDDSTRGVSSFDGELFALLHVMRVEEALSLDATREKPALVELWVTDNQGAAHAINSGRCKGESGQATIQEIFEIAARLRRNMISVWINRELNTDADDLSHFAKSLGVSQIQGLLSDLSGGIEGSLIEARSRNRGEADRSQAEYESSSSPLRQVQCVPPAPSSNGGVRRGGNVLDTVQGQQQGAHHVPRGGPQPFADPARKEGFTLPVNSRGYQGQAAHRPLPQGRPLYGSPGLPIAHGNCLADYRHHGPNGPSSAYPSDSATYSSSGPSACWGGYQSPSCWGFHFQDQREIGGYSYPSHENLQDRGRGMGGDRGQQQQHYSLQAVGAAVCHAGPPQEAFGNGFLHDPPRATVPRKTFLKGRFRRAD